MMVCCKLYVAVSNWFEAMMDFKFLNDRYMRGKAKVAAFHTEKHVLQSFDSIMMAHPAVVSMQGSLGSSGFLGI